MDKKKYISLSGNSRISCGRLITSSHIECDGISEANPKGNRRKIEKDKIPMIRIMKLILIPILLFSFTVCSTKSQFIELDSKESKALLEKSQFLSGSYIAGDDLRLNEFVKKKLYESYRTQVNAYLNNFQTKFLEPLKKWREANISATQSSTVIYPFSGPDFLNIYSLYPNSKKYILIGLEAGGFIPEFDKMTDNDLSRGLMEMGTAFDSISMKNFYVTTDMSKNVSRSHIKGTTPIFLAYLGFLKFTPLRVRYIKINIDGKEEYVSIEDLKKENNLAQQGWVNLEIQFLENDREPIQENLKTIVFLSTDISNPGLEKNPGIIKYLEKQGKVAVTFKAASYLPHSDNFNTFKSIVYKNAEVITMDDTGPKIKSFDDSWDVKVFGHYTVPIDVFSSKYQPELTEIFKTQKPDKIDFRFGYGYAFQQPIILVKKKSGK